MKNFILLCFVLWSSACTSQAQKEKPNLVIIFTDGQGYGDLSCFGGEHVYTPNIDKMADEGFWAGLSGSNQLWAGAGNGLGEGLWSTDNLHVLRFNY